jgi:hypothetical protein
MAKQKLFPFKITDKFILDNATSRGYEMTHAVSEFIDNSIDAGATNIYISKERQDDGLYTLSITDDGCGIEHDKLFSCFSDWGYDRAYGKKSISSFGVGSKEAMTYLTKGGVADIYTERDGKLSHLHLSFNPKKGVGVSDVRTKTAAPDSGSGTSIIITNVDMTDKDHNKLMEWCSFIYYPARMANPNFNIHFHIKLKTKIEEKTVEFVDAMYRDLVKYDDSAVELSMDKVFGVGKEFIRVKAYVFNTNKFVKNDLFSNFDRGQKGRGSFSFERAGIYWKLGNRYSNLGKGNFISITNQHSLNCVRFEIELDGPKLIKHFCQQDKSKISISKDFDKLPGLKEFYDELKVVVSMLVQKIQFGKKSYTENEVNDKERLNDFANSAGDFTGLVGDLEENKTKLPQGKPEDREEIDPTGIKRNRKSGYKQNRDAYRIDYANISPWAPFMELPTIYSNKYIYTINTAHPYYETFAQLSDDAQNHVTMFMVTQLSVLLRIESETDDNELTRKFIEKTDYMLKNWVEGFKYKPKAEEVSETSLDLN